MDFIRHGTINGKEMSIKGPITRLLVISILLVTFLSISTSGVSHTVNNKPNVEPAVGTSTLPPIPENRPIINKTFTLTTKNPMFYEIYEGINEIDFVTSFAGARYRLIVKLLSNSTSGVTVFLTESSRKDFTPSEGFEVAPGELKWKDYISTLDIGDAAYGLSFTIQLNNRTTTPSSPIRFVSNIDVINKDAREFTRFSTKVTNNDTVMAKGWSMLIKLEDAPTKPGWLLGPLPSWEGPIVISAMITLAATLLFLRRHATKR